MKMGEESPSDDVGLNLIDSKGISRTQVGALARRSVPGS